MHYEYDIASTLLLDQHTYRLKYSVIWYCVVGRALIDVSEYPFIFGDSFLNMKKALHASKRRKMHVKLHAVTTQKILVLSNTAVLNSDI